MDKTLENYLERVENYLRPMAVSERIDIVREIKSEMLELKNDGKTPQEILARLGDAREMARGYIGDLISSDAVFTWNRFLAGCAFYGVVGFSGMIIVPTLAIIAPVFIAMGILTPVLSMIKMLDYIFSLGIPYMQNIGIVFEGILELNPITEFLVALPISALLFLGGRGAWKLLLYYCQSVGRTKRKLSI